MNDLKKCGRPDCSNQYPPYQNKEFCSRKCAQVVQKRRKRARVKGEAAPIAAATFEQATMEQLQRISQTECARYTCKNLFVPKQINHKFCSSWCGEQAKREARVLETIENIDTVDPAEIKAKRDTLVLELERQREILQRALVKAESRTSAVLALVEERLAEDNLIRYPIKSAALLRTPGNGRKTDAHLLFSDPQAGKWENEIGLKVLLDDYIPHLINATLDIIDKQRYEGPVETFYLHLLGDLIENCIIYPGQRQYLDRYKNGDSTVDQVLIIVDALGEMLSILRPNFKRMVVANAYGNHGRTAKKEDPNLSKDNYDRLVGELLKRMCNNLDIDFIVPEEDRYRVTSLGWNIGGIHGHQFKTASSLNATETVVLRWDQTFDFGKPLDILCMGHRHHAASLDVQGIEIIQNPAMDGGSTWLTETTGKRAAPAQEFFFVSEKYGLDSRHRIYLDQRKPRAVQMMEALLD